MTDPLPPIDLRLTPDWLKESAPSNRYADYEGDSSQDRGGRGRRDRREERPRRPGQPTDRRRPGGQNDRRPAGPARTSQPSGTPAARTAPSHRPSPGSPTARQGDQTRDFRGERSRSQSRDDAAARPEVEPAPVQVDFLPEERAFAKIIQQLKQGHVAYPLFGLARMFLERPERYRVRIRSLDNQTMIYQFGDSGPVAMDPSALERIAFTEKKDDYYETHIVEKEPIKGNFTSVARCTLSGKLLGPTNYHAFQPNLRNLYEQRFSRRMGFEEYRRTIEISSDPAVVEQWKDEVRKVVTFRTKDQEIPANFESIAAVEQHFRTQYLPTLVKPCLATELSGDSARNLPDRGIIAAIRKARDRENRFPAQIAGALRHGLNQAGLQVFKHKKRILYISTVRPQLFDLNQSSVSPNLYSILSTIRSFPKISRKQLAEKVLTKQLGSQGVDEAKPEYQQARTALISDLIWLAKAGHVIEFSDGGLDLPLPPKGTEAGKGSSHDAAEVEGDDQAKTSLSENAPESDQETAGLPVEQENLEAAPTEAVLTEAPPTEAALVDSAPVDAPALAEAASSPASLEAEPTTEPVEKDEEGAYQPAEAH